MRMRIALAISAWLFAGCAVPVPTPAAVLVPQPTTVVVVTSTAPRAPTATTVAAALSTATQPIPATRAPAATPGTDYLALRTSLLIPLGGLIVATRDNSPTRAAQLAAFNAAGDRVLAAIAADMSVNANRLHSVVVNTRDAVARGDLATLEQQRLELLKVQ